MMNSARLLPLLLALACGDSAPVIPDGGPPDAAIFETSFVTAAHPPAPLVVNAGGSVLASPKVVVVTFANDPLAAQIEAFAQGLGSSAYWAAATGEYGVGTIAYAGAVHVATPPAAPLSQSDFESWLTSQLDGTHPEWPALDASTIYAVVYPRNTGVLSFGAPLCQGTPAYHDEIDTATSKILYAEMNRCDPIFGLSGIDYVTAGLSHELVEASTDPLFNSAPAFYSPPLQYNDWMLATGGELADMCTLTTSVYFKPADLPYTVQRSWSNLAAASNHEPCVPAPAGPYFNAAPVLPDTVKGTYYGQAFTPEGVHVPLGGTGSVAVDLFSDGPTDAFQVSATPLEGAVLDFTWSTTSGQNGDVLTLSVQRNADGPDIKGVGLFVVTATLGGRQSAWVGAVGD